MSQIQHHNLPQTIAINLVGVNPPHLHYIKYENESSSQVGIQYINNNPILKIYDNIDENLMSNTYLNRQDVYGTYENRSDDFGIYAIGNIDFSTWEQGPNLLSKRRITVDGINISNEFSPQTTS